MKQLLVVTALLVFLNESNAQLNRHIVRFKHKGATTFTLNNPSAYLSPRAIARRTRYNISIDSTDLPIPAIYLAQIAAVPNVTIHNASRWLNAITIFTTDPNAITAINALPFVQSSSAIASKTPGYIETKWKEEIFPLSNGSEQARVQQQQGEQGYFNYGGGASLKEIRLHNGDFLHNVGLRGQNMQIAMLDGGFFQYTTLDAFDSAVLNGQFLSTWDFVARDASVVEDSPHGMSCLSTIAANIPGLFIGKAPKANFHLFRTEDNASEYPIEEFNWACGAERADSVGADVISSSIGYGYLFNPPVPDYPYSDLNGNITMSARAADLAAKKGILVVEAAGNSGNDYWRMISTPADADSVIAVGAVNSNDSTVGSFSSYGPSADGQIKPDVASAGVLAVIQTPGNTVVQGNGTSYAAPNMAGLGTCLWQGFPEVNNMRIVRALREAGHIYNNPNDRVGYGIPDMKKAFISLLRDYASVNVIKNECDVTLTWRSKDVAAMKYEIEIHSPGDIGFRKIAEIPAQAGEILSNHNYEFDTSLVNAAAGTYTYRIYEIIDTNTASYTRVDIGDAQVILPIPCITEEIIIVAPNPPAGNTATLLVQTRADISHMQIMIYDMKGSLVMQMSQAKPAGKIYIDLPIGKWAKGKYLINVYDGNKLLRTTDLLRL